MAGPASITLTISQSTSSSGPSFTCVCRSRRQAHTNHAAILHARQTPSLASLNSPQRDLEAETAAGGVGPNARRYRSCSEAL